jgi:hypothetical protein
MTDLEMETERRIRNLITAAKVAEDIAEAAAAEAKRMQETAVLARRAVEQALSQAAHHGFHLSWWDFERR